MPRNLKGEDNATTAVLKGKSQGTSREKISQLLRFMGKSPKAPRGRKYHNYCGLWAKVPRYLEGENNTTTAVYGQKCQGTSREKITQLLRFMGESAKVPRGRK